MTAPKKLSFLAHLGNLARNVFRWYQPSSPVWQKRLSHSVIFPLLAFSWHLLMAIPNLLLNVIRLLTVGLSLGLGFLVDKFFDFMHSPAGRLSRRAQLLLLIPGLLLMGIMLVVGFALLIGGSALRAIFSPVDHFNKFWNKGTLLGKCLAVLFALVTVSAYIALAVFALPAIVTLAPAYLPAFAVTGLNTALAGFTWLAGAGSAVFAPIGAVISGAVGSVFASAAITNALIGLAAVTGAAVAVVGSLWSHFTDKFGWYYYRFALREFLHKPDAPAVIPEAQPDSKLVALDDAASPQPLNIKGAMQALTSPSASGSPAPSQPSVQSAPAPQQETPTNPLHAPPQHLSAIQSASASASNPGSLLADETQEIVQRPS